MRTVTVNPASPPNDGGLLTGNGMYGECGAILVTIRYTLTIPDTLEHTFLAITVG